MEFILIICSLISKPVHARSVDISLTDAKHVRVEDVAARVRWMRDHGVAVESVDVPSVPLAFREIRSFTENVGTDDRPITSLVLNVHELDRRQKYALGGLGVLTKDGPDDALRLALEPLVGRLTKDAHVVLVSPSLRRAKFDEVKPRIERFMNFLGVTDGSCTVVPKTPSVTGSRQPNASAFAAFAILAGLAPLSLMSSWFPLKALPIYALIATAVVALDRFVVTERAREHLARAVRQVTTKPAWRMWMRGGETYWTESVQLLRGFASLRSCAEGLAGETSSTSRFKDKRN